MTPATRPSRTIALTAAGASVPGKPTTSRCPASCFGVSFEAALGSGGRPVAERDPEGEGADGQAAERGERPRAAFVLA